MPQFLCFVFLISENQCSSEVWSLIFRYMIELGMDINILPKTQNRKIDRNSKIRRYVMTASHVWKFANIVIIKFIWCQFSCFELRCSSLLYYSCKDIFWKDTSAKINRGKGNRSFVSDSTWLYNRHCPSSECPH